MFVSHATCNFVHARVNCRLPCASKHTWHLHVDSRARPVSPNSWNVVCFMVTFFSVLSCWTANMILFWNWHFILLYRSMIKLVNAFGTFEIRPIMRALEDRLPRTRTQPKPKPSTAHVSTRDRSICTCVVPQPSDMFRASFPTRSSTHLWLPTTISELSTSSPSWT